MGEFTREQDRSYWYTFA